MIRDRRGIVRALSVRRAGGSTGASSVRANYDPAGQLVYVDLNRWQGRAASRVRAYLAGGTAYSRQLAGPVGTTLPSAPLL